jgi:hypothetical protein
MKPEELDDPESRFPNESDKFDQPVGLFEEIDNPVCPFFLTPEGANNRHHLDFLFDSYRCRFQSIKPGFIIVSSVARKV